MHGTFTTKNTVIQSRTSFARAPRGHRICSIGSCVKTDTMFRRRILHCHQENSMNWDTVKGNWKQYKGKVKEQWGILTDDQLDVIDGQRDQLVGKIQETYGISKEEAEAQLRGFENRPLN
jgi:uncharacterized protein YjbJ (UPF0337 family)